MTTPAAARATRLTACWTFRPRPRGEARTEETIGFRSRLATAIRAGHASGASVVLSVNSGPEPVLRLCAENPPSARWVTRVLAPAYDPNQWPRLPGAIMTPPEERSWLGLPSRPWPERLRTVYDTIPLLDAVVLSLASIPPGVRCEWSFRPSALTHPSPWAAEPLAPEPAAPSLPSRADAPLPPPTRPPRRTALVDRTPLWEAACRAAAELSTAPTSSLRAAARAIESATRSICGNGLRFRPRTGWSRLWRSGFLMTETDVVAAFPGPACPASGEPRGSDRGGLGILPLGRTLSGRVVGPRMEPQQGRHMAILGETGMGKSSLLIALVKRAVESGGLILLDPIGETARSLARELPSSCRARLTWIDPSTEAGLNALAGLGGGALAEDARRERKLNDLVHALRRVRSGRYADAGFWGPRLEEMLARALRAAASLPNGTLVEAHTLLAAEGRGFRNVPPAAMEAVRELGDRIRSRPEDADGARRLLYEVTRSPTLVRMLCRPDPSVSAADLVAPGRIVLIAGEAATVGESTARYLLSVYLALLWAELLARPGGTKTFFVLDEAQWFVHESLGEMLRLGRRLNVHVFLATQAIASLPEGVAEAVWTNVSDFVAFRGSPEEAREFSRATRGVAPEAILSLPRGGAAVLLGKGSSVHWLRTARVPGAVRSTAALPLAAPPLPPVETDRGAALPKAPVQSEGWGDPTESEPRPPEAVLREILRRAGSEGAHGPIRVSLEDLRRTIDPTGRGVRHVGSMLGRSGAILKTGRDASGPFWWIDTRRVVVPRVPPARGLNPTANDPGPSTPSADSPP